MKVVIRADASAAIGLGHVKRCLSLAQALCAKGAAVSLAWRRIDVDCAALIEAAGVRSLCIGTGPVSDELTDVAELLAAGVRSDLIVIDHYALGARWHRIARERSGARLAAIDDVADRTLDVDWLIDPNFSLDPQAKFAGRIGAATRVLAGPAHALLAPAYAGAARCTVNDAVCSIGIFMGGTDAANVSMLALRALRESLGFRGPVEIATTSGNPNLPALREAVSRDGGTPLTLDQPDLAAFFARHDLQIGAGGGATWERCCIGAPTLAVIAADNQRPVLLPLQAMGVLRVLPEEPPSQAAIAAAARELIENPALRRSLATRSMALVDGLGAARVATALLAP